MTVLPFFPGSTSLEEWLGHDETTKRLLEQLIANSEPTTVQSALNIVRTIFGG